EGTQLPVYFNQSPVLNAAGGGGGFFGGGGGSALSQNVTPMAAPIALSPWDPAAALPGGAAAAVPAGGRGGGGAGGGFGRGGGRGGGGGGGWLRRTGCGSTAACRALVPAEPG